MARDQRWYPRLKTQRINSLVNSYSSPPSHRGWGALQGRQAAPLSSRRCSPSPPSPQPGPRPLSSWSTAWCLSPSWAGQVPLAVTIVLELFSLGLIFSSVLPGGRPIHAVFLQTLLSRWFDLTRITFSRWNPPNYAITYYGPGFPIFLPLILSSSLVSVMSRSNYAWKR